jgi:hypothetical protein
MMQPPRSYAKRLQLVLVLFLSGGAIAAPPPVSLNAKQVPLADAVAIGDRVDRIKFLGMLAIPNSTVDGIRVGQLSDLVWDDRAKLLYAITDKGALLHLQPIFTGDTLTDVRLARAVRLRDAKTGQPLTNKRSDAEGLDLIRMSDGRAELILSFERFPRIMRYRPDGYAVGEQRLPPVLANPKNYQDENRMLEATCYDSTHGVLTMPEAPLKGEVDGFNRLFSLAGRSWLYVPERGSSIVSLACLGDGEVLVVEREFSRFMWHFRTTIKRVNLSQADSTATPLRHQTMVALDTGEGFQIDNFEGIARHTGRRFFLVSDDNDFFLERTLLLYFEILDP